MAETTHTSGSRLSALPCPQVYRGSGDCVYQGVRSIMACEDGSSDRIHGLPLETPRTANVLLRIMRARPHARGSAAAISQQSQATLHNNKKHRQNTKKNIGSWAKMASGLRCRRSITGPRPTFPSTSRLRNFNQGVSVVFTQRPDSNFNSVFTM